MSHVGESGSLGSLSQSVRSKQLKSARLILLTIGVLTLVLNGVLFVTAESLVDAQINQELEDVRAQNMVVDEAEVQKIRQQSIRGVQLIAGGSAALGLIYIGLGIGVTKKPVACTVAGLVIYIGSLAVFGLLDPSMFYRGIIIKLLIIVGLAKAVQSAIAYERESQELESITGSEQQSPS